jgi:hypothetical protein
MTTSTRDLRAPLPLLTVAFAGAMAALAGGYWDDAWHTEHGRDEFFIAPHIAIYAGIAIAGTALGGWALLVARRHGARAVRGHKPLVLALVSVVATLASGPIDNAWHEAFGRDAVIWSPPHMLGIAGTLGLGAAILAELAGWREPWARPLTVVAGALVLASAGFATIEYDTDVPQFAESFYLPVLGLSGGLGLLLVRAATDAGGPRLRPPPCTRGSSGWSPGSSRSWTSRRPLCRCWCPRPSWSTWREADAGRRWPPERCSPSRSTPRTCPCATGSAMGSSSTPPTSPSAAR